jgi:glutamate-1-semialdehyde 2,1-aminomutase
MEYATVASHLQRSENLAHRAANCDAWAATRLEILPQDQLVEGAYPLYASRAKGAYFWDADGNRYIDYILGYGTVILGHADPRIDEAVMRELRTGINISPLWREAQVDLAELLTQVIPGAEMAFLMRTGSDTTSGALRLARIYTGRSKVVRWGYNGWHDWSCSRLNGIPQSTLADTLVFQYNDIESVRSLFEKHPKDIACVVMMTFELEAPYPGFLQEVKEVAHEYGALFVLDEMRSGFRMALGGAQEYFGIEADLATYSKAMANGYPISAIVGRSDVLRCAGRTHMASTYYGNSAEMAGAIATISILRDSDAIARVWMLGELLQAGLRDLILRYDIDAKVVGYPPCPFLAFTSPDEDRREAAKTTFYSATIRGGIFFHPNHHWFVSAAHTEEDIRQTLEVCRFAFEALS